MVNRWKVWGLVAVLALVAVSCDWKHYRGGPSLTGVSTDSGMTVANVGNLVERWRGSGAPITGFQNPTTIGERIYFTEGVYDARGVTNCGGAPKTCAPMWTTPALNGPAPSTETATTQYVSGQSSNGAAVPTFAAFDSTGTTNCAGAPKVCTPLWTARSTGYPAVGTGDEIRGLTAPLVYGGRVFVGDLGSVYAIDANGTTNCSGTPKVCTPLWRMTAGGPGGPSGSINGIAAAGPIGADQGTVFVYGAHNVNSGFVGGVYAYDAAGVEGCAAGAGTTTLCQPKWRGNFGLGVVAFYNAMTSMVITGGVVYAVVAHTRQVFAFDEAGTIGCSGSPKVCQPLWTATLPSAVDLTSTQVLLAVAGGRLYVPIDAGVIVYDALGSTNCAGVPKTCTPIGSFPYPSAVGTSGGVTIANGVAYAATKDGLWAFDANLSTGCTGAPAVCTSLWHVLAATSVGAPAIDRQRIHVVSNGVLVTFTL